MWDSAKKPIKIRSVLQPNGMRHYILNEEQEEIYASSHKRLHSRPSRSSGRIDNQKTGQQQQNTYDRSRGANDYSDKNSLSKSREPFLSSSSTALPHSLSRNDSEEKKLFDNEEGDFLGIAGSKICNSKKHKSKSHYSRNFHNFPQSLKEDSLLQLQKDMEIGTDPHSSVDILDLVPVKKSASKKLIKGEINESGSGSGESETPQNHRKEANAYENGKQSTTLCSRIMTWIDLEVKRNAQKGKSPRTFPFVSADLNIETELSLPYDISALKTSVALLSSDSSSSEDSNSCSISQFSSTSSSEVHLPKLVPCWRKEVIGSTQIKVKKSVRIAEDLPRWGKMKRRFGKSRSMSLNELYDDDELTLSSSTHKKLSDTKGKGNRKPYSSERDISRERRDELWDGKEDTEEKETDSMVVCDKKLFASGRVQVHIFLPQTDSTLQENSDNLSQRSGDSSS
ncbi:unnamed protein product [Orchesella dallaii]|uniref:Uncharacterized protein n=1 Tax=Orchesella dallaii TaxID=48710 RepID=A0ABP1QIA2_9HEXA